MMIIDWREEQNRLCDVTARLNTLGDVPYACDLADIGAYKDNWSHQEQIKCHRCNMIYKVEKIERRSQKEETSFKDTAAEQHKISSPNCDLLKTELPEHNTDEQGK